MGMKARKRVKIVSTDGDRKLGNSDFPKVDFGNIEKIPIFLLWVLKELNGREVLDLRAVDTDRKVAEMHQKMIEAEFGNAQSYIEERETNHMYAQRDVLLAFRMSSIHKSGD